MGRFIRHLGRYEINTHNTGYFIVKKESKETKKTNVGWARFRWSRKEQIEEIKDGKVYTREINRRTGLEEIVRYDIKIRES